MPLTLIRRDIVFQFPLLGSGEFDANFPPSIDITFNSLYWVQFLIAIPMSVASKYLSIPFIGFEIVS